MHIPKVIKSGPHTYNVIHSETRDETKGSQNLGKTHRAQLKIWLDKTLPRTRLEETFIHELFHVAWDQAGFNDKVTDLTEEEMVNRLSTQFYALMVDNKMLK